MPVDSCITTEGNTVQEAVNKALRALNITEEHANIEVLWEGKQGFLGVGSQPAKVRVSIKEEAQAERELTDILIDLDIKPGAVAQQKPKEVDMKMGLVEVKEGRLVVTNPVEEGKYAAIKPAGNVKLIINGQEITEETHVKEEDEIQALPVHDEPISSLELTVSDDGQEARLRYEYRPGARYRLKEQARANRLELISEVEEIVEVSPKTMEDIRKFLMENGITVGIDEEALLQVVEQPNSKDSFLIARGRQPVPGVDASVRYPYLENQPDNEEDGLFGRNRLVSVTPGEVIAVKVPKKDGQDGWTVTGQVIPVKEPADCEICVKNGCELDKDGEQAIANMSGRPVVETTGNKTIVSVEPVYEVQEVNQNTGDIKFSGDVEVRGNVEEGRRIEADGNIEVFGDVTRATLMAGASVTVHKMVLGSTIVAGGRSAVYSAILPDLKTVREVLEKMYDVAQQLKSAPGFKTSDLQAKGDGPLIQLLLDNKFHDLPKIIGEICKKVMGEGQAVHEDVLNLANLLQRSLCGLGPLQLSSIELLKAVQKAIDQVIHLVSGSIRKDDSIKLKYVQNSTLVSGNDIIIEGQGGYISSITAGGNVIVDGSPGIARGVKITANGNVMVKELGSEFDTQTSVKIKGKGKVSAGFVHPNVIVQVGGEKVRTDRAYKNFDVYVNHEGRLTVDKLSAQD